MAMPQHWKGKERTRSRGRGRSSERAKGPCATPTAWAALRHPLSCECLDDTVAEGLRVVKWLYVIIFSFQALRGGATDFLYRVVTTYPLKYRLSTAYPQGYQQVMHRVIHSIITACAHGYAQHTHRLMHTVGMKFACTGRSNRASYTHRHWL